MTRGRCQLPASENRGRIQARTRTSFAPGASNASCTGKHRATRPAHFVYLTIFPKVRHMTHAVQIWCVCWLDCWHATNTVVTRGCNPGGSQKASAIPKAFGNSLVNVVEHRRHLLRRGPAQRLHALAQQTVPAQAADFLVPIFLPNVVATARTKKADGADCAVWNAASQAHATITAACTLRQRSHFRMVCGRLVGGRTSDLNQPLLLVLTGVSTVVSSYQISMCVTETSGDIICSFNTVLN